MVAKRKFRLLTAEKPLGGGAHLLATEIPQSSFIAYVKAGAKRMIADFAYHCRDVGLAYDRGEDDTPIGELVTGADGDLLAVRVVGDATACAAFRETVDREERYPNGKLCIPSVLRTENDIRLKLPGYAHANYAHGKRHASMRNDKATKRAAHGAGLGAITTSLPIQLIHANDCKTIELAAHQLSANPYISPADYVPISTVDAMPLFGGMICVSWDSALPSVPNYGDGI